MAGLLPRSLALGTKNFILRTLTGADSGVALSSWADDELAAEMLNTRRREWPVAQQAAYFAKFEASPDRHLLGIFPRAQAHPIGFFSLHYQPQFGTFVITHMIGAVGWRGKDVTTETAEAIYEFMFDKLGYAKAKANVRPQNRPVLWLMLAGGAWRKEARLIAHLRDAATGKRADLHVLGLLAEDWRRARKT